MAAGEGCAEELTGATMGASDSPSDAGSRNQGNQYGATLFLRAGISGDLAGGANSRKRQGPLVLSTHKRAFFMDAS